MTNTINKKEKDLRELFLLGFDPVLERKGRTFMFNEEYKIFTILEKDGTIFYASPYLTAGKENSTIAELTEQVSWMETYPEQMLSRPVVNLTLENLSLLSKEEEQEIIDEEERNYPYEIDRQEDIWDNVPSGMEPNWDDKKMMICDEFDRIVEQSINKEREAVLKQLPQEIQEILGTKAPQYIK